jgi:hypothetical protein
VWQTTHLENLKEATSEFIATLEEVIRLQGHETMRQEFAVFELERKIEKVEKKIRQQENLRLEKRLTEPIDASELTDIPPQLLELPTDTSRPDSAEPQPEVDNKLAVPPRSDAGSSEGLEKEPPVTARPSQRGVGRSRSGTAGGKRRRKKKDIEQLCQRISEITDYHTLAGLLIALLRSHPDMARDALLLLNSASAPGVDRNQVGANIESAISGLTETRLRFSADNVARPPLDAAPTGEASSTPAAPASLPL